MAAAKRMTLRNFRMMDTYSGNLVVVGGSRRRRGVRPLNSQATDQSPKSRAASDDVNGATAGLSAPSAADIAGRTSCAEAAKGKAKEAERTPTKDEKENVRQKSNSGEPPDNSEPEKKQWAPRILLDEGEMQAIQELPKDGRKFVEELNKEIYMVGIGKSLLLEKDVKVKQRVWEQLIDIAYGKNPRGSETARKQIVVDIPSAAAERARERGQGQES